MLRQTQHDSAEHGSAPIRTAIVGLGKVARNWHLPAIAAHPQLKLVATIDRNRSGVAGAPEFTSLADALARTSDLQAIVMCTPPVGRYTDAHDALSRGMHVFLEKPPTASVTEIHALQKLAERTGATLFTTWHSRQAPAVDEARNWLEGRQLRSVQIHWREDVREWHRGQDWIFERGGLGVFDPGINALSMLTEILHEPIFVESARMQVPANRHAPIAATVQLKCGDATPIEFELDFLHAGVPRWDIVVQTDSGLLEIKERGFAMAIDGKAVAMGPEQEYLRLYSRFIELMRAGTCDVDVRPLTLVADAFLRADVTTTATFDW